MVRQIREREKKIHILVNNSGATWGAPFDKFPEKEGKWVYFIVILTRMKFLLGWDRVMALNVKSIFYGTIPVLSVPSLF